MTSRPRRRAGQPLVCGWCRQEFTPASRGRTPKWCSQACRQRAWEQRRAADVGLAAVQVVQQVVEVEKPVEVKVVERVAVPLRPTRHDWPDLLSTLTDQLNRGLVYDRDLPEVAARLAEASSALKRRPGYARLLRRNQRYWR
jgi:hypothetical protein